jgi:putative transposase
LSSDLVERQCVNGEKVRVTFALDCCDKQIMNSVVTTKCIVAALAGDLMMQELEKRLGPDGKPLKPNEWLIDKGGCYTAAEQFREKRAVNKHADGTG